MSRATPMWGSVGVTDGRLEEVDDVLVLVVFRTVARQLEGAVAHGMLAELVAPEVGIEAGLSEPVPVHVGQEVVLAERPEESAYVCTLILRNSPVPFGRLLVVFGKGARVILAGEVAVLREGSMTTTCAANH